ncbi:hypothetical protein QR680_002267 [Steinernema hermaphroditum]|uniref:[histone H3]-trimethyl-L-lysine(4) demethylase n=1 Tax=Steinernema hermaphroditum TaxID=289476 RepID=A0AA39H466_9BILA|nr:hypothetical protein QR680_002267 [Steinernema hermaphroditum]
MQTTGDFLRPPEALVFSPTLKEFNNPIEYIRSILPKIKKYGICKIKAPPCFKPMFNLSFETSFVPREQHINEISAAHRFRLVFIEQLHAFWRCQGVRLKVKPIRHYRIDFYNLYDAVERVAEGTQVESESAFWAQVLEKIECPSELKAQVQSVYFNYIVPFADFLDENQKEQLRRSVVRLPELLSARRPKRTRATVPVPAFKTPIQRFWDRQRRPARGVKRTKRHPAVVRAKVSKKEGAAKSKTPVKKTKAKKEGRCLKCRDSFVRFVKKRKKQPQFCKKCTLSAVLDLDGKYGFEDSSQEFTLTEFGAYNERFMKQKFKKRTNVSVDEIEQKYWKTVHNFPVERMVYYGADIRTDITGSGFVRQTDDLTGSEGELKECYAKHPWNVNNFPTHEDSVLRLVGHRISGMTVPWIYVGMCFSTFCWHVEDHWTYSVNYQHIGATKVWYGIPEEYADKFDEVARSQCPEIAKRYPDMLHHMTTMIDPNILQDAGIPVFTVHQNPREYVITLPRAYHSGFNTGFNINEAVNFAPSDWLKYGAQCVEHYSKVSRHCVFSFDELVVRIAIFILHRKHKVTDCIDVIRQLLRCCERETEGRERLKKLGMTKSENVQFESLKDDERCCHHCNTTLFHSSVKCPSHNQQVCIDHVEHLCGGKCEKTEFVLCYRYVMPQLEELVAKLKNICDSCKKWQKDVAKLNKEIADNKKPTLEKANQVMDEGLVKKYPFNNEVRRLDKYIREASHWVTMMYTNQASSGRNKNTKRLTPKELEHGLMKMEESLLMPSEDLLESTKERHKRAILWREKYVHLKQEGIDRLGFAEFQKRAQALVEEGDLLFLDFDQCGVCDLKEYLHLIKKTPDIEALVSRIKNWDPEVGAVLPKNFKTDIDPEKLRVMRMFGPEAEESQLVPEEFLSKALLSLANAKKSSKARQLRAVLQKEQRRMKMTEKLCTSVFQKKGEIEHGLEIWRKVAKHSWADSPVLNRLRLENECVRKCREFCQRVFERDPTTETSYIILRDVQKIFTEYSFFLHADDPLYTEVILPKIAKIREFMVEMQSLFVYDRGYYSFFEILGGRQDLVQLAEGSILKLEFKEAHVDQTLACSSLYQYSKSNQMIRHMELVYGAHVDLLQRLQGTHGQRPVSETCHCGEFKLMNSMITCYLCRTIYHGQCILWDPVLETLPRGIYLCHRCIRGKRPTVSEVSMLLNKHGMEIDNTYEYKMIKWFVEYAMKASAELNKALSAYKIDTHDAAENTRLQRLIMTYLSLECHSKNVNMKLSKHPYFERNWPFCDVHREMLTNARKRCNGARMTPPEIYTNPLLPAHMTNPSGSVVQAEVEEFLDQEGQPYARRCAFPDCLEPLGEDVMWVQCDRCQKWHHYVCAGATIHTVNPNKKWECVACEDAAVKPPKHRAD